MKNLLRFLLIIITWNGIGLCQTNPQFPTSEDPQEFPRQAEEYLLKVWNSGGEISEPSKHLASLKDDKRDWESVVARIIGDSEKYGFEKSELALNVASHRGTTKDPRIVEATGRYWEAQIRRADELYEHFAAQGKPKHPGITGRLQATIPKILEYGVPKHLSTVLDYFNSSADDRNGIIFEAAPPAHIAAALRNYGDERHISGAKMFSKRLREIGRIDMADDIDRSVERIERDQKRSDAERVGKGSSPDSVTSDGGKQEGEEGVFTFPWIVGGVVVVVFISAGVFFLKRKK